METKMHDHIAFFLPSLAGGGAEKVFLHLAYVFCDHGIALDIVLGRAEGPYLVDLPAKARVIDLKVEHMAASLFGLSKYLAKERPDVLLAAIPIANIVAVLAKKFTRVQTKIVACLHSVESRAIQSGPFGKRHLIQFLYPMVMRTADSIIAVSHGVVKDFIEITGSSQGKVQVIHNPIVSHLLYTKAAEAIIEPWFRSAEMPVILAVGRLSAVKDFETLIRAFSVVRKKIYSQLIILGEGEERSKLENLLRELKLKDDVHMPGFVNNPYKFMKNANVLVVSSISESFGNVLVEAMACGCQVVSTDCPVGPTEILERGTWGTLVPVGDYRALAKAIVDVIYKKRILQVLERAKDFSVDKISKQYLQALGVQV